MEDAESLAQTAVERLSEDEALRGDLTDDGFGPLLNWAANAAIAYAQSLQSDKPDEAMDAYAARLKGVMQEVVAAAKAGKIDDPAPLLDFQMNQPEVPKTKLTDLQLAEGEDDANAVKITEVLSDALNAPALSATQSDLKTEQPQKTEEEKPAQPEKDHQPAPAAVETSKAPAPANPPESRKETLPVPAKTPVSAPDTNWVNRSKQAEHSAVKAKSYSEEESRSGKRRSSKNKGKRKN